MVFLIDLNSQFSRGFHIPILLQACLPGAAAHYRRFKENPSEWNGARPSSAGCGGCRSPHRCHSSPGSQGHTAVVDHRAPTPGPWPPFPGPPEGRPVAGRWSFAGVSAVAVSVLQSLIYKAKPSRVWSFGSSGEEKCGIHFSKRSGQLAVEGRGQYGGTNESVKSELRVMSCLRGQWQSFSFQLRFRLLEGCGK